MRRIVHSLKARDEALTIPDGADCWFTNRMFPRTQSQLKQTPMYPNPNTFRQQLHGLDRSGRYFCPNQSFPFHPHLHRCEPQYTFDSLQAMWTSVFRPSSGTNASGVTAVDSCDTGTSLGQLSERRQKPVEISSRLLLSSSSMKRPRKMTAKYLFKRSTSSTPGIHELTVVERTDRIWNSCAGLLFATTNVPMIQMWKISPAILLSRIAPFQHTIGQTFWPRFHDKICLTRPIFNRSSTQPFTSELSTSFGSRGWCHKGD
jgi:hypothetical protein